MDIILQKRLLISTFSFSHLICYGVILQSLIQVHSDIIWECKEYTSYGRLVADCSNQNKIIGVPTNLNPKIQVLNLSSNKVIYLTNQSFKRYKDHLIVLDLSRCFSPYRRYDAGAFTSLNKLLYLNMSGTCLSSTDSIVNQQFPKTVVEFIYTNCHIRQTINLTSMENLQVYIGVNTQLHKFPIFNTRSQKIKSVNLVSNPLGHLDPIEMAPYCLLEEFIFELPTVFTSFDALTTTRRYCACMKIRRWLDYARVKYAKDHLKCKQPIEIPKDCNYEEIDPQAIEIRNKCLVKFGSSKYLRRLLISLILVVFIIIIALPILIFLKKIERAEHSDVLDADEQDAYNDEEFVSMEKFEEENNEITE